MEQLSASYQTEALDSPVVLLIRQLSWTKSRDAIFLYRQCYFQSEANNANHSMLLTLISIDTFVND